VNVRVSFTEQIDMKRAESGMNKKPYVLVLDEGTTGTKAFVFDKNLNAVSSGYRELALYSTSCGRAELDSEEIFEKSVEVCREAIQKAGIEANDIACMGIDAQRSTLLAWEKDSGKAWGRAVSWQDTRLGYLTDRLQRDGMMDFVFNDLGRSKATSGIFIIKWMDENIPGFHARLVKGDLIHGSVDSWLVYRLTGCKNYRTSIDHATLNGTVDFHRFRPTERLFDYLELPSDNLPQVLDNAAFYGVTDKKLFGSEIPITCVIADQHASLFAQRAVNRGDCKCTNGTGAFLDLNVGHASLKPGRSHSVLLAWRLAGTPTYVAECFVPATGTFQRWIKKVFGLESYKEIDDLAAGVEDSGGAIVLPTLFGTLHPRRDPSARAAIMGISESCGRDHIMRGTLEGIAFFIRHIADAMTDELGVAINDMRIDGGLANSDIFCRILSSVMKRELRRSSTVELTALGAAEIAGMQIGLWDEDTFDAYYHNGLRTFSSSPEETRRYEKQFDLWQTALERSLNWPQ
jgi:glycerol kinase